MNNNWEDSTSYSRDKERIQNSWTLNTGKLSITVTFGHIYFPGEWVYICEKVGVSNATPLKMTKDAATAQQAQRRAVAWVKSRLESMIRSLE